MTRVFILLGKRVSLVIIFYVRRDNTEKKRGI